MPGLAPSHTHTHTLRGDHLTCWPPPHCAVCCRAAPRLSCSLSQSAGSRAAASHEAWRSLPAGGDIFLILSASSSPSSPRPIMLYQIPWPFERSRRWTRYTPRLNVNNLSLTSTSEHDTLAPTHVYLPQHISPPLAASLELILAVNLSPADLWDALTFTRTKKSRWFGGFASVFFVFF